jgi:hypothetical protein
MSLLLDFFILKEFLAVERLDQNVTSYLSEGIVGESDSDADSLFVFLVGNFVLEKPGVLLDGKTGVRCILSGLEQWDCALAQLQVFVVAAAVEEIKPHLNEVGGSHKGATRNHE